MTDDLSCEQFCRYSKEGHMRHRNTTPTPSTIDLVIALSSLATLTDFCLRWIVG